jgi:DNA repair photolyase
MHGDTPILLADGTTKPLADIRAGDAIYGTARQGWYRRYVKTRVLAHWSVIKAAHRITLEDGTRLVAGSDHRFLTERGWKFITGAEQGAARRPHLTTGNKLMGTGAFAAAPEKSGDYERGYLSGLIRGDGMIGAYSYVRVDRGGGNQHQFRLALCDAEALDRAQTFDICGQPVKSDARLAVAAIEPMPGAMRLYDITTETGDFIADGVVSHNCYARPSHAYMGLSAGIDFETRLFYKADAGKVLEQELAHRGYVCKPIMLGANTDPYQPVERELRVTRAILEVLARTRHPVALISKSALVLRDLDLLQDLARDDLVSVAISVTTLSADTKRSLEPRTASPEARLRALRELSAAGIPCAAMVAPVIPAITDHEMEAILEAARDAGARSAGYVLLRLPYEVKDLFREWLTQHFPDRAAHVMALINDMRGGRDNDPQFGSRMRGTGPIAELLRKRFALACKRLQLNAGRRVAHDTTLFRPPTLAGSQLSMGF